MSFLMVIGMISDLAQRVAPVRLKTRKGKKSQPDRRHIVTILG